MGITPRVDPNMSPEQAMGFYMALVPSSNLVSLAQLPSLRRGCFCEQELIYSVRGAEQQYLLKDIGVLLVKCMNEKIRQVSDLKFRNIQKLTEIRQQILDIGKELAFHSREQVMTDMIE